MKHTLNTSLLLSAVINNKIWQRHLLQYWYNKNLVNSNSKITVIYCHYPINTRDEICLCRENLLASLKSPIVCCSQFNGSNKWGGQYVILKCNISDQGNQRILLQHVTNDLLIFKIIWTKSKTLWLEHSTYDPLIIHCLNLL